jgi:hypothetical protein
MYEVDLDIYDVNGVIRSVRDFWVFSRTMSWKVIHAAEACGLIEEYKNKTFLPEVIRNKNCLVSVRTQEGKEIPMDKLKGKPVGSKYPTKNVINDYLKLNQSDINAPVKNKVEDQFSDDIPF